MARTWRVGVAVAGGLAHVAQRGAQGAVRGGTDLVGRSPSGLCGGGLVGAGEAGAGGEQGGCKSPGDDDQATEGADHLVVEVVLSVRIFQAA
ncbi:hypothetical protein ACF1AX_36150 [Streptomyces sp. NPDC014802]|uniref:hypothetical protein n=1 Tax=Streptomyces sp. NPDC014802 TaxID=3364917 RepID=UPI0036F4DEFE